MDSAYAYVAIIEPPGGPDSVSTRLGLIPTRVERKGELRGRIVARSNRWILESPVSRTEMDLRRHVCELLAAVEPKRDEIRELVDMCSGRFTVVAFHHYSNQEFSLTKDQASLISQLGLEVWCDFYSLSEDEPNQLPDPTSPSVTPPAGAGGAPSVAADH